jgi:hypothetical protein
MKNAISKVLIIVFLVLFSAAAGLADYLAVPACAFHSYNTDATDYTHVATYSSSRYIYALAMPDDDGYCYAPVNLPQGVRISGIVVFAWDNHASANIEVALQRHYQLSDAPQQTLFSVATSGNAAAVYSWGDWALDAGTRIVNNNNYQYTLRLRFMAATEQLRCYGVKVIYTY